MKDKLLTIIDKFKQQTILVIGDIMLDKYVWGDVSRISPEAPVQIIDVVRENFVLGGAANVSNNCAEFGGNVFMVGVTGQDKERRELIKEFEKRAINTEGVFIDEKRPTIQKVRIMGRNQQLLRIDYESKKDITPEMQEKILNFIKENINQISAVVISDYVKGLISKNLVEEITQICKTSNKLIIADPKPKNFSYYKNMTLITPNHIEANQMAGISEDIEEDIKKIGDKLMENLNSNVLITRGEKGMSLFELNGNIKNIPTIAKEVYDVTGAGDTAVATITLALSSGATMEEAAILANHAAGIKVGKVGTATVTTEELKESLENDETII